MQLNRNSGQERSSHGIPAVLLSEDREQAAVLANRVDSTQLGRVVFSHLGLPTNGSSAVLRLLVGQGAEVVLVEIESHRPQRAFEAMELIRGHLPEICIFAVGEVSQPNLIVSAMRAGAVEFVDRNANREAWIEAFARYRANRGQSPASLQRSRVYAFLNAKGGSGATTVAVNTAVALQRLTGKVVLVDLAALGHAALHLNLRPAFGVVEALQSFHRMDASLLQGLVTQHKSGLHLLAGPQQPTSQAPSANDLMQLFDLLTSQYAEVVVDGSGRADDMARLIQEISTITLVVAQADQASLWSARQLSIALRQGDERGRAGLVMNRYQKIPGMSELDLEEATGCRVFWTIPNNYAAISAAVDKGSPIALQEKNPLGRSFAELAKKLTKAPDAAERSLPASKPASNPSKDSQVGSGVLVPSLRVGR